MAETKVPEPTNIPRELFERVTSGFNLSVATGLAMETLFEPVAPVIDPDRDVPEKMSINKDYLFMVNLETLYRNLLGSMSSEFIKNAMPEHLAYVLVEEMRVIDSLCAEEGGGYLTPYYFSTDYTKTMGYIHKSVKVRTAKTPLQLHNKKILDKTLEYVHILREDSRRHESINDYPRTDSCLMFSHYPYDLLFFRNFRDMVLLESHTGKLKSRVEWNSKYYPYPHGDMSILPFNRTLLCVFGDRVMIHPHDLKMRKYVMDTAVAGKWTPLTTREKMISDFKRFVPEPYIVTVLLGF